MKDIRGVDIHVGAKVIYFKTGRYPKIMEGVVLDMKKKVKVGEFVNLTQHDNHGDTTVWADNTSLVLLGSFEKTSEDVPAPVTLPETTRVDLSVLYPHRTGEDASAWTTRVLSHAKEHGTYRQCSIGWHGECSQADEGENAECNCICHAEGAEIYSVEGHAEGGEVTVTRTERGRHHWPAQEGEPETMWAWWVYARSEAEATEQGAMRERNRLMDSGLQ